MAQMRLKIPAPCNYNAALVNHENGVVIKAYDNKEKEKIVQNEGEGK